MNTMDMMDTTIVKPKREFPIKLNRKSILIMIAVAVVIIGVVVIILSVDKSNHDYVNGQLDAAEEYLISKKYDKALECCDNAKGVFSDEERVYIISADVYIAQGDKEKAKKILEEGLKNTNSKEVKSKLEEVKIDIQYDEFLVKGQQYHLQGNYKEAISTFNSAIAIKSTDERAYLYIAESYIQNGEKSFARDILKLAYEKAGSEKARAKYIELEAELQSAAHQTDAQNQAEKAAKEAKKLSDDEKRQKEQAEEKAMADALEKAKQTKASTKNTEWKSVYKAVLLNYLKTQKSPEFENPYIREIDDLLPKKNTRGDEDEDEDVDEDDEDADLDEEGEEEEETAEGEEGEETSEETSVEGDESGESSGDESSDGSGDESGDSSTESSTKKKEKKKEYAFELYDMDMDGIPELIVSDGSGDMAVNEIYTYANGAAIPFENKSFIGKIAKCEKEKLIRVTASEKGIRHIDFYRKNGINLDPFISFFDGTASANDSQSSVPYTDGSQAEGNEGCTINGVKTPEMTYRAELRKYNSYTWKTLGRKFTLNKKTIINAIKAWTV